MFVDDSGIVAAYRWTANKIFNQQTQVMDLLMDYADNIFRSQFHPHLKILIELLIKCKYR
jgi:hypothetical protein